MIQGILIRQKDGIYRQVDINTTADGYYKRVNGKLFRELFRYTKHNRTIVVCEGVVFKDEIDKSMVFNRLLPILFNHLLIFGDVLLVELGSNGDAVPLSLENMSKIINGTHPIWSVGTTFETLDESDSESHDSEVGEEMSEDDDDETTYKTNNTKYDDDEEEEEEEEEDEDEDEED